MTQSKKTITRRDFLQGTTCATLALAMGLFPEEEKIVGLPRKTKVILIRDPDVLDAEGQIDAKVIRRMLDQAVTTLLDKKEPVEAWKLLVKPEDIVGIKSNVWGPLPTPKELEQAIKGRVMDAGVQEKNIEIDDRGVLQSKIFGKATALINARPLRTHAWSGVGGCIKNYIMFVPRPSKYHGNSCEDLGAIWNLPLV
ncbi:MAG: twin-arginine translocation signal domain-containing protein, partial [Candidatus Zixiibacteriota bacterium]